MTWPLVRTPAKPAHVSNVAGRSAATMARNVGAPGPPDTGPRSAAFCACVFKAKDNAGVELPLATEVVNSGLRFPALNDVTVPVPAGMSAVTNARNVGVATPPDTGPAHTVFAVCVAKAKVKAGVVVAVATDVVPVSAAAPA